MRYPRLRWSDLVWGIGIFVGGFLGYGLLSLVNLSLIKGGIIPLPGNLPVLANPLIAPTIENLNRSAGGQIHGQWAILILCLIMFFFNMAGEESWWPGYILPRQELAFGRWAWLIHGTMWACFHAFKWWDILPLLPICLLIAFISQKRQNNWAGLIAHILMNGMAVPLIAAAVAGWI
jgi:membrane protease YdiL (CAAX protease family)